MLNYIKEYQKIEHRYILRNLKRFHSLLENNTRLLDKFSDLIIFEDILQFD